MKTTSHRLTIEFKGVEGAFLRILGLMERRGYHLHSCSLIRNPDGNCKVDIVVESDRPGDLLKRQLERLYDVTKVQLQIPEEKQSAVRHINVLAQT